MLERWTSKFGLTERHLEQFPLALFSIDFSIITTPDGVIELCQLICTPYPKPEALNDIDSINLNM